jgi:hypothetical protein
MPKDRRGRGTAAPLRAAVEGVLHRRDFRDVAGIKSQPDAPPAKPAKVCARKASGPRSARGRLT